MPADSPETPTPTETPAITPEPAPVVPTVVPPNVTLGENGEKALKAERDARRAADKANTDLLARLKAFEDRDKSEAERQADRLAELTRQNETLSAERARYAAAIEHGLSAEDLALLGTGTPDDIAARAALLAARLGGITAPPVRLPPSPNAGTESAPSDDETDFAAYAQYLFPTRQ